MKIECQCSNCGKVEKVSAMAGIPEGIEIGWYEDMGEVAE